MESIEVKAERRKVKGFSVSISMSAKMAMDHELSTIS